MRSSRGISHFFELLIMVCVTVVTLVPSYVALSGITRQLCSLRYPSVQGTIADSKLEVGRDSDGDPTYRFSVRYVYQVEGRSYESTQSRYSAWNTFSQSFAEQMAARFPEKSTVPVYYRPGAPGDAVLVPGLQSTDLMLLLVMTPFVFAMAGGWYDLARKLRKNDAVRSFVRDGRTHVTLSAPFPLVMGLVAAGGCAVLLAIILGVGWGQDVPVQAVLIAWGLMVVAGVIIARRTRIRRAQGRYDLILDEQRRRLLLPAGPERKQPIELAWKDIATVKCLPHPYEDSDGIKQMAWRPVLELTGARGPRSEVVAEWSEQDRAEALTDWLRLRLGR
ncbi:MAG TPA: DUF3592 domain-containing protein [Myxococcaceae bacterium]|jgi:hypothetical protein